MAMPAMCLGVPLTQGVEEDLVRGLGWFQKGSDAGNADSMFYLAHMTENGQGVCVFLLFSFLAFSSVCVVWG